MYYLWKSCAVGLGGGAACWGAVGSPLTGAGPRSQRGLESPGAEVGRCSLKDEGHRQGDKHGPLSTWWPLLFFVCLFFESHFLLSSGLSSCRGSLACLYFFYYCFLPGVRKRWRGWTQEKKRSICLFFLFCVSTDSHLSVVGGGTNKATAVSPCRRMQLAGWLAAGRDHISHADLEQMRAAIGLRLRFGLTLLKRDWSSCALIQRFKARPASVLSVSKNGKTVQLECFFVFFWFS